jgi:hypothetical protein
MRIAELRDNLARRVGAPLAGDGGAAVEALRVDKVRRQGAMRCPRAATAAGMPNAVFGPATTLDR